VQRWCFAGRQRRCPARRDVHSEGRRLRSAEAALDVLRVRSVACG
jgi:hypothetical protein